MSPTIAFKVVIAGNRRQFLRWCETEGIDAYSHNIRYIAEPDQLRGLRNYTVERVGTWFERDDLHEIDQLLAQAAAFGDLKGPQ